MIDRDGNRIGEITDIYLDNETGRPEWAVVRTGLFGLRSTFAPLAEATEVGEQVQIRHQRAQVKDAPNIEPDGQLSEAEEAELYRHYGLDYDAVTMEGDTAAGTLAPGWRARSPAQRSTSRPGRQRSVPIGIPGLRWTSRPAPLMPLRWPAAQAVARRTPGATGSPDRRPDRRTAPTGAESLPLEPSRATSGGAIPAPTTRRLPAWPSRPDPGPRTRSRLARG